MWERRREEREREQQRDVEEEEEEEQEGGGNKRTGARGSFESTVETQMNDMEDQAEGRFIRASPSVRQRAWIKSL